MTDTDYMMRNSETGQFEPTSQREIVDDYLSKTHDLTLSELIAAYRQKNDTLRGKLMFG